jgi:hypothetical protein
MSADFEMNRIYFEREKFILFMVTMRHYRGSRRLALFMYMRRLLLFMSEWKYFMVISCNVLIKPSVSLLKRRLKLKTRSFRCDA